MSLCSGQADGRGEVGGFGEVAFGVWLCLAGLPGFALDLFNHQERRSVSAQAKSSNDRVPKKNIMEN